MQKVPSSQQLQQPLQTSNAHNSSSQPGAFPVLQNSGKSSFLGKHDRLKREEDEEDDNDDENSCYDNDSEGEPGEAFEADCLAFKKRVAKE